MNQTAEPELTPAMRARMEEVRELNALNGGHLPPLRFDSTDAAFAEARAAAFERRVEIEARHVATEGGLITVGEHVINRMKPGIRLKMLAALDDGSISAPLKKLLTRQAEHEEEAIELMREVEEANAVQLQAESMLARRKDLVTAIARAEGYLAEAKAHVARNSAELDKLFLLASDTNGGPTYDGLLQCYQFRYAAELMLADAGRQRKLWEQKLAALDKHITAFRKEHGLS